MFSPRMRALTIAVALSTLVGCASVPDDGTDGAVSTPASSGVTESGTGFDLQSRVDACLLGAWGLNVNALSAEAASYLESLQIPVEGYSMNGVGHLEFFDDGTFSGDIDVTSTGSVVVQGRGEFSFAQPTIHSFAARWSPGDAGGQLDVADWVSGLDATVAQDPEAPTVPVFDLTNEPLLNYTCTAETLTLQGATAPYPSVWVRI